MADTDIKPLIWNSLQAPFRNHRTTTLQSPCRDNLDSEHSGLTLRSVRGSYVTSCEGDSFLVNSIGHCRYLKLYSICRR